MNFLQATEILKSNDPKQSLEYLLAMSGQPEKLDLFLRAACVARGYWSNHTTLGFGALQQELVTGAQTQRRQLFLLFPWDLLPSIDWRLGLSVLQGGLSAARDSVDSVISRVRGRTGAQVVYIDAPFPPIFAHHAENHALASHMRARIEELGATVLGAEFFALGPYLAHGNAIPGSKLGELAVLLIDRLLAAVQTPCKVIATDLDHVMWHGVIGEAGLEGIGYQPEGPGYKHFIYQSYLKKLKSEGLLLTAVSRNDEDLALGPFRQGQMQLQTDDFVAIIASYNAKSAQLELLAKQLNLGLDAFVFVDDNPLEIEEVHRRHPQVKCIPFPTRDDRIPEFFDRLAAACSRRELTREDAHRTEMYRARLRGLAPSSASASDLSGFLAGLEMKLEIHDRTHSTRTRAVQLINKTNQFNLNGIRRSESEVDEAIAAGSKLWTASLRDKHGSHGEIMSCLVSQDGEISTWVMSCRVFQRRVELAFIAWLMDRLPQRRASFRYQTTERNQPMRMFFESANCVLDDSPDQLVTLEADAFRSEHGSALELFELSVPEP